MKKILGYTGNKIFPRWNKIRAYQRSISPEVHNLPEPNKGIYFNLSECCQITASRIISNLGQDIIMEDAPLKIEIKFGFDGSGGHAIFNQLKNVMTNNMIIAMFCPISIKGNQNNILWEQQHPNAATSQRPLMIEKGKDSTETLNSIKVFNADISRRL